MNPEALEGCSLGKYRIQRRIGEGNMSIVYLARDPFIDREVAIKVAHPARVAAAKEPEVMRRLFFNEAQTAGMLRHPNITAIFDAGVEDGVFYIAMEYVPDGRTLEQLTSIQSLVPLEEVTQVLFQAAQALDYAHRRGVVHRDVKPRNILLTPTTDVKLSDFGVAVMPSRRVEIPPVNAGSPLYMSPEQVQGQPTTPQTDLFALGVIAYQLLTGHHPFAGSNLEAIQHQILTRRPTPVSEYRANVPPIFQRIVDKAIAKSALYRYKTGSDMAGDLALVFDFLKRGPHDVPAAEKFSRVRTLRFFAEFPELELWEIVNAGEWLVFRHDEPIVQEGDVDSTFYVIVDGSVAVRKGTRDILRLKPGDCLGEMAMFSGRRRSATNAAENEVTLIRMRGTVIDRTSVNCQLRFQRKFLNALIERLENATELLGQASLAEAP